MTGNNDGSVSLFNGSKLMKTKKLNGFAVKIAYFNNQIVAAAREGSLTVMNKNLGIIKEVPGLNQVIASICGNSKYLALCDIGGAVRYYKRNGDLEPKVMDLT